MQTRTEPAQELRVSYSNLYNVLLRVLVNAGFAPGRAELCARLFADASRDGVATHGLNRFPRFMEMVRLGVVDIHASPERVASSGALSVGTGDGDRAT